MRADVGTAQTVEHRSCREAAPEVPEHVLELEWLASQPEHVRAAVLSVYAARAAYREARRS